MIAGIDRQLDISICLKEDEIKSLSEGKKIAGILIRTENPYQQGIINTQICDDKKNLNGFGIGIDVKRYWEIKEKFELDVFIGNEYFSCLQERGRIGTRQTLRDGSKISLYNSDINNFEVNILTSDLEFYRDNKEKYRKLSEEK